MESWLLDFGKNWQDGRLPEQVGKLPPPGSPLRLASLVEMVKIDLAWQPT